MFLWFGLQFLKAVTEVKAAKAGPWVLPTCAHQSVSDVMIKAGTGDKRVKYLTRQTFSALH